MRLSSSIAIGLLPLASVTACQQPTEADSPASAGTPSGAGSAGTSGSGAGGVAAGGGGTPSGGTPSAGAPSGGMATGGGATGGGGSSAGGSSTAGSGGVSPIEECPNKASIDRYTEWNASGEGQTVPATGTILVKEGNDTVGKVDFVGSDWHVIPVLIANKFDQTHDLTSAVSFTLTYSATAELHVQLRSKSHWSGGAQYATTIPGTAGKLETRTFSFAEANWQSLFDPPALSWAETLKEGMGLVFVGNLENKVVFTGLRIDGYTPTCP